MNGTRAPPCLNEPSDPSVSAMTPIEEDPVTTSIPLPLLDKSAAMVTAERTVEATPWDTSAWETIIVECRALDVRHAREYYEAFLDRFPTASRYWKFYAQSEEEAGNTEKAQAVISRGLENSPSVDLFRYYVQFVQRTRVNDKKAIEDAFEHALNVVYISYDAGLIWEEYLSFLKELPEENHLQVATKQRKRRSAYRRALSSPIEAVDKLWNEYELFEKEPKNEAVGSRLLKEISPIALQNKQLARELSTLSSHLRPNVLAVPEGASMREQEMAWRKIIEWEKSHAEKAVMKAEQRKARVRYAYKRCLSVLRFIPELWYEFAEFEKSEGDMAAAAAVMDAGTKALPGNLMLNLAQCDFLEQDKRIEEATHLYARLRDASEETKQTQVWVCWMRFARRTGGVAAARKVFAKARKAGATFEVYVTAALMEHRTNKLPDIAKNVFELGLKKFGGEVRFIMAYVSFLVSICDENNLRVLFERTLSALSKEDALPVWYAFLRMELRTGDLHGVASLEERMRQEFPDDLSLKGLPRWRYTMFDVDDVTRGPGGGVIREGEGALDSMQPDRPDQIIDERRVVIPATLGTLVQRLPSNVYSVTQESDVDVVMNAFLSYDLPSPPPSPKTDQGKDDTSIMGEPAKKRRRT